MSDKRKVTMDDALAAGDGVILNVQAARIKELEERNKELAEAIEAAIASGMVGGDMITSGPVTPTPQGEAAVMLRIALLKAKGEEQ